MHNGKRLILSMTTYPKRWEYFVRVLNGIKGQTAFGKIDEFVVNIDDNLTEEETAKYVSLENEHGVKVKVREAKWKSMNKIVWTYIENPDAYIITIDDDKLPPEDAIATLLSHSERHPDCIVASECNPLVIYNGGIRFVNGFSLKLNQKCWDSYLSNVCLFPPDCFSREALLKYEIFSRIFMSSHDEKALMVASMLKGTQVINTDMTYSYALDRDVTFPLDETSLSHVNGKPENIAAMNATMNSVFGTRLIQIAHSKPVEFYVDKTNAQGFVSSIPAIAQEYRGYFLTVNYPSSLPRSWLHAIARTAERCGTVFVYSETGTNDGKSNR